MGSHLATSAIAQVAAGCRPESFLAASHIGAYSAVPLVRNPPELRDGRTVVPLGPGLGVDVDVEALGEPLFSVSR
jgi:L-alanine-DL-glutamate epimerase-like enolase superfamily enzyme